MAEGAKRKKVTGIWEPRCRLCKLSKSHPDLVEIIHQWKFGDGKSYRDIVAGINEIIHRDNLDLREFNIACLTAHLNDHVPADTVLVAEAQEAASSKRKRHPADPDIFHRAIEVKRKSLEKIEENLLKWQKIYEALYKSFDLDGENPVLPTSKDVDAMAKAHSTWAELVTAKERLLKERNFVKEVLQQGVDYFGRTFAQRVLSGLIEARDKALEGHPDSAELIEALFAATVTQIKESITGLYDETIQVIGDRFTL